MDAFKRLIKLPKNVAEKALMGAAVTAGFFVVFFSPWRQHGSQSGFFFSDTNSSDRLNTAHADAPSSCGTTIDPACGVDSSCGSCSSGDGSCGGCGDCGGGAGE